MEIGKGCIGPHDIHINLKMNKSLKNLRLFNKKIKPYSKNDRLKNLKSKSKIVHS